MNKTYTKNWQKNLSNKKNIGLFINCKNIKKQSEASESKAELLLRAKRFSYYDGFEEKFGWMRKKNSLNLWFYKWRFSFLNLCRKNDLWKGIEAWLDILKELNFVFVSKAATYGIMCSNHHSVNHGPFFHHTKPLKYKANIIKSFT